MFLRITSKTLLTRSGIKLTGNLSHWSSVNMTFLNWKPLTSQFSRTPNLRHKPQCREHHHRHRLHLHLLPLVLLLPRLLLFLMERQLHQLLDFPIIRKL